MDTNSFVKAADKYLAVYDIYGSIAHVKMLSKQKILSTSDARKIISGLHHILTEILAGKNKFIDSEEDIHTAIEKRLTKIIGPIGGKMHTARSRNDQVVLDMKLFLRDAIYAIIHDIKQFQKSVLTIAKNNIDTIMPGFTHLQPAQPVLFSHYILSYAWMIERDKQRYISCLSRMNESPLGAAALAGTTFKINRNYAAHLLGFDEVSENSMDTVSSRDFLLEFLSTNAITMSNLSRLTEDIIIWSSPQFGFLQLDPKFTTGSSIMPQKVNPDFAELVRGKTGQVYGNLVSLLTIIKGLPLTYNRDLQEDKTLLSQSYTTTLQCIKIMAQMLNSLKINSSKMLASCRIGYLEATDIADYLAQEGVPFRQAHGIVKNVVSYCIDNNKTLGELTTNELLKFSDKLKIALKPILDLKNIVNQRNSYGGTAKTEVLRQIKKLGPVVK